MSALVTICRTYAAAFALDCAAVGIGFSLLAYMGARFLIGAA